METVSDFIFLGSKITADDDCSHEIKRHLLLRRKAITNPDSILKSRDIALPYSQGYGFSSSHALMWELDHKEGWAPKNWCFQIVLLKKTLESPLDSKEIISVSPTGNQPWILNIHWEDRCWSWSSNTLEQRVDSLEKDPEAGKDWRQEEKGETEDEMVGWHHWLNGHEFEQTPRNSEGQRSLVCCSL